MKMKYGLFLLVAVLILGIGGQSKAFAGDLIDSDDQIDVGINSTLTKYWATGTECTYFMPSYLYPVKPKTMWCQLTRSGVTLGGYVSYIENQAGYSSFYYYEGYLYPLDSGIIIAPTNVKDGEEEDK